MTYHISEGAMIIDIADECKVLEIRFKMPVRNDYLEWKMSKDLKPTIHIDYTEYRSLLELVGQCARILEKNKPVIEDNDLLLIPLDPDRTIGFDYNNQLSNQAFKDLEESLFGSRVN